MALPVDPIALTEALICCASVTPADVGALDVVEAALRPLGFHCRRLPFQAEGTRRVDNLYATLGDRDKPHLCFAGHTDVVPVGCDAAWTYPPFEPTHAGGMLYGRGACDMKSAVAAFIAGIAAYLNQHPGPPPGKISLLITGDEEGPAVNGTRAVLAALLAEGQRFDACIVGEPTSRATVGDMVKIGRRGSVSATITVHGTQGHVAYPHLADNPLPRLAGLATAIADMPLDNGNTHFQPSTLSLTSIDTGNTASNVIPAAAQLKLNIRYNTEQTEDSLRTELETLCAAHASHHTLDYRPSSRPFLTMPGPLSDLVTDAITAVTGTAPELSTTGGTSDARFFAPICPVVECGLVGKTLHQVDEHVASADIVTLAHIYAAIITRHFACSSYQTPSRSKGVADRSALVTDED
jgi:succinyl-diaminopimelate desuccinylase